MHVEEQCFRQDMQKFPKISETSRGMRFWNTHPASKLLRKHIEMEMTGTIEKMKPQEIWATEEDYQSFDLNVFRKHIYQERRRQLAAPFWQVKRNKNARKQCKEVEQVLKQWSEAQLNRYMERLVIE